MTSMNRLQALQGQTHIAGLHYINVDSSQIVLDVHFYENIPDLEQHLGNIAPSNIRIYSEHPSAAPKELAVHTTQWLQVGNPPNKVLRLTLQVAGGFYLYRIHIEHPLLDRFFNDVAFSFKASCPQDFDCQPQPQQCPPKEEVDFPVNYLARDFESYREALLDFAQQRYPHWQDRLEADVGMMLVDIMSALGDELAYYQDRIAREAYLSTATQGRSIRQLARLVDYQVHNGRGASGWIDVTVSSGAHNISAGSRVWALSEHGERIYFEVGHGAIDTFHNFPSKTPLPFNVRKDFNHFTPHIWDEDHLCLEKGATSAHIKGDFTTSPNELSVGKWLLLRTSPLSPNNPPRTWMIRLTQVTKTKDYLSAPGGEDLTHIAWEKAQALPFPLHLKELNIRGNLLPLTAGMTKTQRFVIGMDPEQLPIPEQEKVGIQRAIERVGPNGKILYRMTLDASQEQDLVWLGDDLQNTQPELLLEEAQYTLGWSTQHSPWKWRPSLLQASSSLPTDRHYTLEQGSWGRIAGFWNNGKENVYQDYVSNKGNTLRFGDGDFGSIPPSGTIFQVTYRLGNGPRHNISAGTITHFDASAWNFVTSISNPLPTTGGNASESPEEVRLLAPEAFQAETYRAVRSEDYKEAAERLDWVQQAGATARWTGSWLSMFTTADAKDAFAISAAQQDELHHQIQRFRQANQDVAIQEARYANLDLKIAICIHTNASRKAVKDDVTTALFGHPATKAEGFFSPNNFSFATPLHRSALESTIQKVTGVHSIGTIQVRRRGWFDWKPFVEWTYTVGSNEMIRIANNPDNPAFGSVQLQIVGGI